MATRRSARWWTSTWATRASFVTAWRRPASTCTEVATRHTCGSGHPEACRPGISSTGCSPPPVWSALRDRGSAPAAKATSASPPSARASRRRRRSSASGHAFADASASRALGDLPHLPEQQRAAAVGLGERRDVHLGHGEAVGWIRRDLALAERLHPFLARQRRVDVGPERLGLARRTRDLALAKLRHHRVGEQLERFADVLVAVLAALLDEDRLVDADVLEGLQRGA